jgi:hypothetical protein
MNDNVKDWIALQLDRLTDGQFLVTKLTTATAFITYLAVMGVRKIYQQVIGLIIILFIIWLSGLLWNSLGLKKRYTEKSNRYLKVELRKEVKND